MTMSRRCDYVKRDAVASNALIASIRKIYWIAIKLQ
jgi:hypothetical protein